LDTIGELHYKEGKKLDLLAHTNMRTSFPPSIVDEGTRYDCFWRWAFLSSYLSFLCKVFSLVKFWICFCCKLNDYLKKKFGQNCKKNPKKKSKNQRISINGSSR